MGDDSGFFKKSGVLFLTNKCNNKCIICQDTLLLGGTESVKTIKELKEDIDFLVSKGKKFVNIYGGEPYLNPNLQAAIDYISKQGLTVLIFSNARVFSDKATVKGLRGLKDVRIQTSLFSHREKIHDCHTGVPGSYSQTIEGIRNLVEEGIGVDVNVTLTRKNLDSLGKTVEFLVGLGIESIKISGLINQGRMRGRPDLIPDFDSVKREIARVLEFTEGKKLHLGFEKLPLCVAPKKAETFFFEPQHKEKMVSCPPIKEKCVECGVRRKCMCA